METRKHIRLKEYDYSQNGYYFITICTVNKQKILCDIVGDDAHIVPTKYGTVVEKFIKTIPGIDKYVIMPNHIHLIVKNQNGTMRASSSANLQINENGTMWASSSADLQKNENGTMWASSSAVLQKNENGTMWASSSAVLQKNQNGTMWASSPTTVSQKIKSFKILVTKTIGKPIFQRSFYDHIIRDERDYLRIREYIENNPGKWTEDKYYI